MDPASKDKSPLDFRRFIMWLIFFPYNFLDSTNKNLTSISVKFTLNKPSFTIISLSQLDTRYFQAISGSSKWNIDFVLYKRGETEITGVSYYALVMARSVTSELNLEAGEYIIFVSNPPNSFWISCPLTWILAPVWSLWSGVWACGHEPAHINPYIDRESQSSIYCRQWVSFTQSYQRFLPNELDMYLKDLDG